MPEDATKRSIDLDYLIARCPTSNLSERDEIEKEDSLCFLSIWRRDMDWWYLSWFSLLLLLLKKRKRDLSLSLCVCVSIRTRYSRGQNVLLSTLKTMPFDRSDSKIRSSSDGKIFLSLFLLSCSIQFRYFVMIIIIWRQSHSPTRLPSFVSLRAHSAVFRCHQTVFV